MHTDKRTRMRPIHLLILIACLAGLSLLVYSAVGQRSGTAVPDPLQVDNRSGKAFTHLGLMTESMLLLSQTDQQSPMKAAFPRELLGTARQVQLVGLADGQQPWMSAPLSIAGDQLLIESESQLSTEVSGLLATLPSLDAWVLKRDGKQLSTRFAADTQLHYQLVLLGKGGQLVPSGFATAGQLAEASWELGRGGLQAWLMIRE